MSRPTDLLEQARHLSRRERGRPRQASLCRAASAAYYALFHLLGDESAKLLFPRELRTPLRRAFDHGKMRQMADEFRRPSSRVCSDLGVVPTVDLQSVAKAFIDLQEARHKADYDASHRLTRSEVNGYVMAAQNAFDTWKRIRNSPEARAVLTVLLVGDRWRRQPMARFRDCPQVPDIVCRWRLVPPFTGPRGRPRPGYR